MIDFLILYEIKPRELESIILLGNELKHRGYTVEYLSFEHLNPKKFLQNKKYIKKYFNNVKTVITPSLYHDTELYTLVYYAVGKAANIVDLRWEQSLSFKEETPGSYTYPTGDARKCYHLCWGQKSLDSFLKDGIERDKLLLAGSLQMDFLREQLRPYYLDKKTLFEKHNIPLDKKSVLYISSFAISSMTERQIKSEEENAGTSLYREKIAHAKKSQEQTYEWIEELLKRDSCFFIYRPHPAENVLGELRTMEEKYPNFKVISEGSVKQWILTCDVLTTWMSTSIIEAYFAGLNCAIVRPIPFKHEDEVTVYENARIIDNKDDFLAFIENNNIKSLCDDVVHSYYDVAQTPSYVRLADELEKIVKLDKPFDWDDEKIKSFEKNQPKYTVQSMLVALYVPLMKLLVKMRGKGFSFGNALNERVDSFEKGILGRANRLATDDEINSISNRLNSLLYGEKK